MEFTERETASDGDGRLGILEKNRETRMWWASCKSVSPGSTKHIMLGIGETRSQALGRLLGRLEGERPDKGQGYQDLVRLTWGKELSP